MSEHGSAAADPTPATSRHRCVWSHRVEDGVRDVALPGVAASYPVCPAHEPALRAWAEQNRRRLPGFAAGTAATVVSGLLPLFWRSAAALGIPLLLLGLTLLAFPFATPYTIRHNGVAGSMRIVRVAGGAFLLAGGAFLILA